MEKLITREYLRSHPNEIFVFGDNTKRFGKGGAAILRDEPNVYGFITKIYPAHDDDCYYTPKTYGPILEREMRLLIQEIKAHPDKTYLITELGGGLANRFNIRPMIVKAISESEIPKLNNVRFV